MARLSEYRYHLAALFTVSVWGATFVSTKALIAAGLTPAEIFLMRFALGYLCILPLAPRRLRAENRRDEAAFAAAGVCGGSLYFLLENVSLLVCTAPVWTALAAGRADRGERMTRRQAAGAALAAAGMALVVLNGRFVLHISPAGDLLALAAALSWMGYSLVIKRLGARYPASFIARKVFFYGMATILPVFAFRPFAATGELLARPVVWANLLFLGVVASGFCYALWNAVMRRLGAVRATNYIFFNPLVTMLTAALCIGERITAPALAGAAMILCGMWHAERR